jgi:hypothetical protein
LNKVHKSVQSYPVSHFSCQPLGPTPTSLPGPLISYYVYCLPAVALGGVSVASVTPRCENLSRQICFLLEGDRSSLARFLIFFLYSVGVADEDPTSCLLCRRLCLPGNCTVYLSPFISLRRGRLLHVPPTSPACLYATG